MPKIYRTSRIVEWHDTDAAAIAHFSAFFRWMEEAECEFLRHLGLSVSMPDADGSISFPRVSVGCDYRSAVKFEDVVDIALRVSRLGEKSVSYVFDLTCGGRDIATIKATAVCCRILHGRPPVGIPLPPAIADKLRDYAHPAD